MPIQSPSKTPTYRPWSEAYIRILEKGKPKPSFRKLLRAAGTLPDGSDGLADGNCLFDTEDGSIVGPPPVKAGLLILCRHPQ